MKNKKWIFIVLILLFVFVTKAKIFAQEQQPPEITEKQVFLNTSDLNQTILANLSSCGLGVSYGNPQNVEYMPNPQINWSSPNTITVSAEKFVNSPGAQATTYNNFSMSGNISIGGGNISFSRSSFNPQNVEDCITSSMTSSISSSLTYSLTPSQYNTYDESLANLKCGEIQGSQLMLVYDSRGASNVVPSPYEFCAPKSEGGMLEYSGGSGGGGGGGSGGGGGGGYTPPKEVDLSVPEGGLFPGCPKTGCGFNELLKLVNKVIHFILFDLAMPIAAIMFAYAGFLLLTSGGNPETKNKAKKIFWNVFIGFVIALAAWLIVKTILSVLGYTGTSFLAD